MILRQFQPYTTFRAVGKKCNVVLERNLANVDLRLTEDLLQSSLFNTWQTIRSEFSYFSFSLRSFRKENLDI
jgi:hypothetical protein